MEMRRCDIHRSLVIVHVPLLCLALMLLSIEEFSFKWHINIFQMGWFNHQLVKWNFFIEMHEPRFVYLKDTDFMQTLVLLNLQRAPYVNPLSWRDFWECAPKDCPLVRPTSWKASTCPGGEQCKVSYFEWSKVLILNKNRRKNCLLPVGHLSVSFVLVISSNILVHMVIYIHLHL